MIPESYKPKKKFMQLTIAKAKRAGDRAGRTSAGERIGITRRGKLAVVMVSAGQYDLSGIFENLEVIRRRARRVKGVHLKDLIEEGRS